MNVWRKTFSVGNGDLSLHVFTRFQLVSWIELHWHVFSYIVYHFLWGNFGFEWCWCCSRNIPFLSIFLPLLRGRLKAWQRLNEKMTMKWNHHESSQNVMKPMKEEHQERWANKCIYDTCFSGAIFFPVSRSKRIFCFVVVVFSLCFPLCGTPRSWAPRCVFLLLFPPTLSRLCSVSYT